MLDRLQAYIESNKEFHTDIDDDLNDVENRDDNVAPTVKREPGEDVTEVKEPEKKRAKGPVTRDEAVYMRMLSFAFTLIHSARCVGT